MSEEKEQPKEYVPKKVADFEPKVKIAAQKEKSEKLAIDKRTEWLRLMREDESMNKFVLDEVRKEIEICDTLEGLDKFSIGAERDEEIFRRVTTMKFIKKIFKPLL